MEQFKINLLFLFLAVSGSISATEPDSVIREKSVSFHASYIGDALTNAVGGIKQQSAYLGILSLELGFDTEIAGWWKGGNFFVKSANTHGSMPSAEFIGDLQISSNIEAGNHTFLQEFWYKQTLGSVDVTIGLQDLNSEIAVTDYGSLFINSSFGVIPIISYNMPAPIFPLTSFGLTLKWNINENFRWLNAFYDGEPTDFKYNPFNVNWEFHKQDGLIALSELQYSTNKSINPGTYKIGLYNHNHFFSKYDTQTPSDSIKHNVFGVFAHADKTIWTSGNRRLGFFAQSGYDFTEVSACKFYIGGGVNFCGLFKKDGGDQLGLATAHASSKTVFHEETVIELTYLYPIGKRFFVQPDIQYIINPSGTENKLPNSLIGILRFGVEI